MRLRVVIVGKPGFESAPIHAAIASAGHEVVVLTDASRAIDACAVLVVSSVEEAASVRMRSARQAVLVVDPGARAEDERERAELNVAARVAALAAGADDAMTLPAPASQMVARVDALGRRAALLPTPRELLFADGCVLDLGALTATRDGVSHELTALEARLLRWLADHSDRAVSRDELLERVWGHSAQMETRTIDMTVTRLRKKIERDPSAPRVVRSVKGVGYRFGAA